MEMAPNLISEDSFFERILAFDFYRDLVQDNQDDLERIRSRIRWQTPLTRLKSHLSNVAEYHENFYPLFLVECLQMLTKAKYSEITSPWVAEPFSCQMNGVFGSVLFANSDYVPFAIGDVVLIVFCDRVLRDGKLQGSKRSRSELDDVDVKIKKEPISTNNPLFKDTLMHCLGFVESVFTNRVLIKILLLPPTFADEDTFSERDMDRMQCVQEAVATCVNKSSCKESQEPRAVKLEVQPECQICKLTSITTALREFRGLTMLNRMPLKNCLLSKNPNPVCDVSGSLENFDIPDGLKETLYKAYNHGQRVAIANTLLSKDVTLIQGPPGTGKTTTIMGIISVILQVDNHYGTTTEGCIMDVDPCGSSDFIAKNPWFATKTTPQQLCNGYSDAENDDDDDDECLNVAFDELEDIKIDGTLHFNRTLDIYDAFKNKQIHRRNTVRIVTGDRFCRRILICAPSNAAIDEIVKRLVRPVSGGIYDLNGNKYNPIVTRIGPNIHEDLQEYSLEDKVKKFNQKLSGKHIGFDQSSIKREIIMNSDIVCSTLSACGSNDLFSCVNHFHTVIVDEATQSVEPSTLIALGLGAERLVLVGDPCQLSATVCSKAAIKLNYHQSLFQRLQHCGYPVNLLNMQYRMDPQISRFPSMYFYQNKLLDAPGLADAQPAGWCEFPLLRSTVFYAIDSYEERNETSYANAMECELVRQLLDILFQVLSSEPGVTFDDIVQRIAIISPYSAQVQLLKQTVAGVTNTWKEKLPHTQRYNHIDVSTVDGFQGMEKDIVIFSAVRTKYIGNRRALKTSVDDTLKKDGILTIDKEPHDEEAEANFKKLRDDYLASIRDDSNLPVLENVVDVSFIADRRRINVAITRACKNLLIIGNPRYLLDHAHWNALYNHYAKCGSIFVCRSDNGTLASDYLREWSRQYTANNPAKRRSLLKNPYLKNFCTSLTR